MQGQDPFDEFRSRRKVQQLESDMRGAAERKRARLRELLGREEDDEEKVRRRVEAEMEDFFHTAEEVDEIAGGAEPPLEAGPPEEIQHQIASVLGPDDAGAPGETGTAEPPRSYDDLESALERLRQADTETGPAAPSASPARATEPHPLAPSPPPTSSTRGPSVDAPTAPPPPVAPEASSPEASSPDAPDWLDLTEERIAEPRSAASGRAADDFDFGDAVDSGPVTRARPGVIDPFATPQPVAPRTETPSPAPAEPPPPSPPPPTGDSPAPHPVSEPEPEPVRDPAHETRVAELERRVLKLEAALDRLTAMVEAWRGDGSLSD